MSTEVQIDRRQQYRHTIERLALRELEGMLGEREGRAAAAQFALAFRAAAQASPNIYECEQGSVALALAMSLLTRLLPGGPMPPVYLIPRQISRKDDRGRWIDPKPWELQWQLSWRGLVILAQRAGFRLRAAAVYEGDEFEYADGLETVLRHVPADGEPDWPAGQDFDAAFDGAWKQLRGVWVVAHEVEPARLAGATFVGRRKIERRRDVSDAWRRWVNPGNYGRPKSAPPWVAWPEEMAIKTALRYAVSRGLVGLDDVGRMAFDHDGLAERESATETIDVAPPPAKAGAREAVRSALALDAPREAPPGDWSEVIERPEEPEPVMVPDARKAIPAEAPGTAQERSAPAARAEQPVEPSDGPSATRAPSNGPAEVGHRPSVAETIAAPAEVVSPEEAERRALYAEVKKAATADPKGWQTRTGRSTLMGVSRMGLDAMREVHALTFPQEPANPRRPDDDEIPGPQDDTDTEGGGDDALLF